MPDVPESAASGAEVDDRLSFLVRRRYRRDEDVVSEPWSKALETLLAHRTIRSYLSTPVPEASLQLAISAAQSAPSSGNLQAWSVIAVEDAALKSHLNGFAGNQVHIEQAPLLLVWLADLHRLRTIAASKSHPSEGLDYIEHLILAIIDVALAAQNALVAFESLGLGTCYIGGMRNHPEKVAAALNLPAEVFPVFGMTVGYPDPAAGADIKPRFPREVVLHRERYDPALAGAAVESYDAVMRDFQVEQSKPAVGWVELMNRRIRSVEALRNRHLIREALHNMGFPLK